MTAPGYFAESISSDLGFWGIRCENIFDYLVGKCGENLEDDDEDVGEEVESLFQRRNHYRRIDGVPEGNLIKRPQWQLMGEHCNTR